MVRTKLKNDPKEVCKKLIPKKYWRDVIEALGESIKLAHSNGHDRWGIRLTTDSIMLKVGQHEVLQLGNWDLPFHLIVDSGTVPLHLRSRTELYFSGKNDCYGNSNADGYYPAKVVIQIL